ncbi:hypothetical protein ACTQ6A_01005 [Lachnospiraceae bacterium LCP25S3_G4]
MKKREIILPLLALFFVLLVGFIIFTIGNDRIFNSTQEELYLVQEVDINGKFISSRTISEKEFQMMKIPPVNRYRKGQHVRDCNQIVTTFYRRFSNCGVYYFLPSTITYIVKLNPMKLWSYKIIRKLSRYFEFKATNIENECATWWMTRLLFMYLPKI